MNDTAMQPQIAQLCAIVAPPVDTADVVPVPVIQWLRAWAVSIPVEHDTTLLLAIGAAPRPEIWATTLGDLRRFIENV